MAAKLTHKSNQLLLPALTKSCRKCRSRVHLIDLVWLQFILDKVSVAYSLLLLITRPFILNFKLLRQCVQNDDEDLLSEIAYQQVKVYLVKFVLMQFTASRINRFYKFLSFNVVFFSDSSFKCLHHKYTKIILIAASTSSIASSMTARNSPKEKRQANSPLPKPPDVSPDDMYAKVLKKRKGENDRCNSRDSVFAVDPEPTSSLNFHAGPSNVPESKTKQEYENYKSNETDDPDRYACGYEVLPERK